MRYAWLLPALGLFAPRLFAQATPPATPLANAAAAITPAGLSRHLAALATDSTLERDTPSRGLELTARYVAAEFAKLKSQPGDSVWIQRYPIPGNLQLDYKQTQLTLSVRPTRTDPRDRGQGRRQANIRFTGGARFAVDTIPSSSTTQAWGWYTNPPTYLVAGPHTEASLKKADLRDKMVLYVPPAGLDSSAQRTVIDRLRFSNWVIVLPPEDPATFAQRRDAAIQRPLYITERHLENSTGVRYWATFVQPDSIADLLASAGIDRDSVRASTTPVVREVPSLRIEYSPRIAAEKKDTITAPNVIARFQGAGAKFRTRRGREVDESIVITAHMDRVGANGDNAAGVAAVLELARAFSKPEGRSRRSVTLVVTSGSERNFWGSSYWIDKIGSGLGRTRVAINLDNLGRNTTGAIAVDGLNDFTFAKRPDWIAAEYPDLALQILDGGSVANVSSDHVAFVRKVIPALYIHDPLDNGTSISTNLLPTVDVNQLARATQFVFYVGYELGKMDPAPTWTATGRQNRAGVFGQFGQ